MTIPKKIKGRPVMASGHRNKKIDVRFSDEEFQMIVNMENEFGIRRTDLIRIRLLHDSKNLVINAKELIKHLDDLGTEIGRIGNNVNQLARHANTLNKQGMLSPIIVNQYNELLQEYNSLQSLLEVSFRQIIRKLGK